MQISVVIPTYNQPEALKLCLDSCLQHQVNENDIVVVVDGTEQFYKELIPEFKGRVRFLVLPENEGLCRSTNLGVYAAKNDPILVINDDNVFPEQWDKRLLEHWQEGMVLTPNQIEPVPSPFKQFYISSCGRSPVDFDMEKFLTIDKQVSRDELEDTGSTLPFVISRTDYFRTGGWDENYDLGVVADWEFFMKCQMMGLRMVRTYNVHLYHFGSLTTKGTVEASLERRQAERTGWEYAEAKWKKPIKHDINTNLKYL